MIVEDQHEVADFLADVATYGAGVRGVRRIDTHGAMVFLAGERAYKLKRAVKFDYKDFSTLDRRKAMCDAEVRLNRRPAPRIYLRSLSATRGPKGLVLGGSDPAIEWLVEMVRFDEDTLFDRMAESGALTNAHMLVLAEGIAAFHSAAQRRTNPGGTEAIRRVVKIDADALELFENSVFTADELDALQQNTMAELEAKAGHLDDRGRTGFVRHLHGGLHLRNICLVDGRPTLFDAIEFNDVPAVCDVWYFRPAYRFICLSQP